MADWIVWLVMAGVLVTAELFSGTFYLLMLALGAGAGAAVAALGGGMEMQMIAAGIVGAAATVGLRRSRIGNPPKTDPARDPNVNMDIGQTLSVTKWHDGGARVMYRGAQWDVVLAPGCEPTPGTFTIREVQGSRLIVANS